MSIFTSVKDRLLNTTRPPRSWLRVRVPEPFENKAYFEKRHEEASKTLRRTMFAILGFSLFSVLTLLQPDEKLLASNATITLPFANTDISYVGFLIAGPAILIGFWIYQQIFLEYLHSIEKANSPDAHSTEVIPFIFNLESPAANLISKFLLDWMGPITLCFFTWKALPRAEVDWLILATGIIITATLFVLIRRTSADRLRVIKAIWVLVFLTIGASAIELRGRILLGASPLGLGRTLTLTKAVLSGQDLRNAVLTGAVLIEANLSEANLSGANLTSADLSDADLRGARNLSGANLSTADLRGADLRGANLSGARNLTMEQVRSAITDPTTSLPDYLQLPKEPEGKENGKP